MHFLGFEPNVHKKCYYVDGLERTDVVAHRNEFLEQMDAIDKRSTQWEDGPANEMEVVIPPTLADGEKEVVLITHDECIIYSNDSTKLVWTIDGEGILRPKSNGRSLHISGFACACHGFCRTDDRSSYKIIKPGKNADGYWSNKDLIKQLNDEVFQLIEEFHPGKDLIFSFDNSANHHAISNR
jgi:hypothetical protein